MPLHFLLAGPAGEPLAAASSAHAGDAVALVGAEAHHAAAVRRVRVGEEVTVGDGRGAWMTGICEVVTPREVVVRVTERTDIARAAPRIVLVQALAKGDRDELAIQAATELGVDEIVPWQAARSVSRWDSTKAEKGRQRWATIVREAAKQAHRAWVPDVSGVLSTSALVDRIARSRALVLEPTAETALTVEPLDSVDEIVLVVGPEGGIAPDELAVLTGAGARPVRLGATVLRTSTAGPAAIAVLNSALGRW